MVTFWDKELDYYIAKSKVRIKFAEKHGMGIMAMDEKSKLKKQERSKELRKQ